MSGTFTATLEQMQAWARGIMASRPPDFEIGANYIQRWWAIPRNDFTNVYLHLMTGNDDDRALHDHPSVNTSVILEGGYIEHMPEVQPVEDQVTCADQPIISVERRPGETITRRPMDAHRLELRQDEAGLIIPCLSMFSTGPKERSWGFHCPGGWVHWKQFTKTGDHGQIGAGCGETA